MVGCEQAAINFSMLPSHQPKHHSSLGSADGTLGLPRQPQLDVGSEDAARMGIAGYHENIGPQNAHGNARG